MTVIVIATGTTAVGPDDLARHRRLVSTPGLWPRWPLLPVSRRAASRPAELGVMFDARGLCGLTGYSATVFLANLFDVPPTAAGLLALPREAYDSADEVAAGGWRVD